MNKIKFLIAITAIIAVVAPMLANLASACSSGYGETKIPECLIKD